MIVHQRFQGSGGLSCNTQVNTTNFKDPRIKNPGVFLLVQCNKLRERGPGNALKTCSERAATRMESLLWEEKLDRIKVFSLVPSNGLDSIAESTLIHTFVRLHSK